VGSQLPRGRRHRLAFPAVRSQPPSFGDVFELHVSLRHIEPTIWRALRVPADASLGVLHAVLQTAFGWQNSHLHDFRVGEIRFGMVDVEDEMFCVDEHAAARRRRPRRVQARLRLRFRRRLGA
jgi:hypothetical protein